MWIIQVTYKKPLATVETWLEEHRSFLDRQILAGHVLASGPQVPRTGGVILARAMPRAALDAILEEDPFVREDVAVYDLREFQVTKGIPALKEV